MIQYYFGKLLLQQQQITRQHFFRYDESADAVTSRVTRALYGESEVSVAEQSADPQVKKTRGQLNITINL